MDSSFREILSIDHLSQLKREFVEKREATVVSHHRSICPETSTLSALLQFLDRFIDSTDGLQDGL